MCIKSKINQKGSKCSRNREEFFEVYTNYFRDFEKQQVEMSALTVLPTVLKAFFYLLLVSMFRFPVSLIHSLWISFCIFLLYFFQPPTSPRHLLTLPTPLYVLFISEKNKKTTATIKCDIQFKITKYEARHGLCVKSSVTS